MEKARKIVIIGGGACGPKTAARARRLDPDAQITMLQDEAMVSYAGCGLPYFIAGQVKPRNALIQRDASSFKKISNVDVLINTRVEGIDRAARRVMVTDTAEGKAYSLDYDELVISTGADPVVPPLPGIRLTGVHVLKRVPDADAIIALADKSEKKKAVIVGAGLIGVEMAEALAARGFAVTMVEALDRVLAALLDEEITDLVFKHLQDKGIVLKLGQKITAFEGADGLLTTAVTDKESIEADLAILAIGVRPNSKLAREAGLEIGPFGDIAVDGHMRTNDPHIYAGGDCVANVNLVTGKKAFAPMGSTANRHGHVIASNITGGSDKFHGIVSTACVKVFDFNVGRTGIGEKQARDEGFEVVTALVPGPDKPDYYPGAKEIVIKLIVDGKTGRILGGQGAGPGEVVKRIDVLATAITAGMTVGQLADLDLAYAPPFNTALDVLHHAANLVLNKMAGRMEGITPPRMKKKLADGEDFVLLDVRAHIEHENTRIEAPQVKLVPQFSLLKNLDTLPKDKEIVVMCRRGGRAYQSACMLRGAGFKDVKVMEGSLTAWTGEVQGKPML
jgi:NADPH-dependent 2,4-dienoyl-CoA reductase/sulfur reductase-like enzyme/rhodanese-related sulfurtransferase